MQQSEIIRILEVIEQEEFITPTFIASGHETVAHILGEKAEFKTLLHHKGSSLPLMRERYREQDAKMTDEVRLVYFVAFGLARDREMTRDIILYLNRFRDKPISSLLSPWHPFLHGMHALEKITGGQIQAPGSSGSMKQFDEFLNRITKWLDSTVHKQGV